jgi:hypothetical protein
MVVLPVAERAGHEARNCVIAPNSRHWPNDSAADGNAAVNRATLSIGIEKIAPHDLRRLSRDRLVEGAFIHHNEYGIGKIRFLEGPNVLVVFKQSGEKIMTRALLQNAVVVEKPSDEDPVSWTYSRSREESHSSFVPFSSPANHPPRR